MSKCKHLDAEPVGTTVYWCEDCDTEVEVFAWAGELRQQVRELEAELTEIANIMHHGGLIGKTDYDLRRLTLPYWDKEECARLIAQDQPE